MTSRNLVYLLCVQQMIFGMSSRLRHAPMAPDVEETNDDAFPGSDEVDDIMATEAEESDGQVPSYSLAEVEQPWKEELLRELKNRRHAKTSTTEAPMDLNWLRSLSAHVGASVVEVFAW